MDIKIFVCCHQPAEVPQHPLLIPLQVGAALAKERFPGFLYDDIGDNISDKNRSYCELTGQYWAWKNVDADYYGFFHYRRYLYPNQTAKRPYCIRAKSTLRELEKLHFSDLESLIPQYDMILPKGENMYISVREHYASAPFHHSNDMERVEHILLERHPEYSGAVAHYLSDTTCYFGNIFIMKRQLFHDYCGWLFSLLEEFDQRADISDYSAQERRVDGYLAERLLGIYATQRRWSNKISYKEIPRVHWIANAAYWRNIILNFICPPGTYQRAAIKKIWRK